MRARKVVLLLFSMLLSACAAPVLRDPVQAHLNVESAAPNVAPNTNPARPPETAAPSSLPILAAPPQSLARTETYDVTVHQVPVRDLLFVLARDAKLNMDIHADVAGEVTLNAVNQTLPQLLSRISRQADVRFEQEGNNLVVMPDTPFLRHYKVDYVNLSRQVSGAVATNTQISAGVSIIDGAPSPLGNGNISSTRVENASRNQFWESLEKNIKDILRETDRILPEGVNEEEVEFLESSTALPEGDAHATTGSASDGARRRSKITRRGNFREAAAVMVHPESGVLTVRATARQHERVREFVSHVENAARRQVMIEATIVEVELSDGYQQGIEWSRVWSEGNRTLGLTPPAIVGSTENASTPFVLNFTRHDNPLGLTLRLLQSFGVTKVLSSPRLSVLNNQTALLKVVENVVYFNIKADVASGNFNSNPIVAYTTTPQTVSVGLVMTVTPQISDNDSIILNVRPTISSISGMVKDPNPDIPANLSNEIPQIRTREIESVLRVANGEIAVLGGLMEDRVDYGTGRVPILGQLPLLGEFFTSRDNAARKSELVIFLRPVVIHDPGLAGDFAALKHYLPEQDFFTQPQETQPLNPAWPGQWQ
jgi:general secretion pathway protein D